MFDFSAIKTSVICLGIGHVVDATRVLDGLIKTPSMSLPISFQKYTTKFQDFVYETLPNWVMVKTNLDPKRYEYLCQSVSISITDFLLRIIIQRVLLKDIPRSISGSVDTLSAAGFRVCFSTFIIPLLVKNKIDPCDWLHQFTLASIYEQSGGNIWNCLGYQVGFRYTTLLLECLGSYDSLQDSKRALSVIKQNNPDFYKKWAKLPSSHRSFPSLEDI